MSTSAGLGTPGKTLRKWEDSEGGENKGGIEGRPGPGWPEKEEAREETESDRFLGALSSPCLGLPEVVGGEDSIWKRLQCLSAGAVMLPPSHQQRPPGSVHACAWARVHVLAGSS